MTASTRALRGLLETDPVVATVGVPLLADALRDQAVSVTQTQWQPPMPGTERDLARVMGDPRRVAANALALERMTTAAAALVEERIELDEVDGADHAAVGQHLRHQMRLAVGAAAGHDRAGSRDHRRVEEIEIEAHMQMHAALAPAGDAFLQRTGAGDFAGDRRTG